MSFLYVEGSTTVKNIVLSLSTELIQYDKWNLIYPQKSKDISNVAILTTVTSKNENKNFFLKIRKSAFSNTSIYLSIGDKLNEDGTDLDINRSSAESKFSWYRDNDALLLGDWLPVSYWISFNNDFVNLVLQGDPSPDLPPYNNYLISYAYIGMLESYEGADNDSDFNFGLTVSSNEFPKPEQYPKKFGNRTGTGITDITMVGTRTGTPYQAHDISFHTTNETMDKNFISASNWTHKYHFSEIVVTHAYDRERGKMQNVLIGDRSAIFHLDELIENKGEANERIYKMFNINAPYSIINNSPNVLYGIAIRKV